MCTFGYKNLILKPTYHDAKRPENEWNKMYKKEIVENEFKDKHEFNKREREREYPIPQLPHAYEPHAYE